MNGVEHWKLRKKLRPELTLYHRDRSSHTIQQDIGTRLGRYDKETIYKEIQNLL